MNHEKSGCRGGTLVGAAAPKTYAVLRVLRAFVRADLSPGTGNVAVPIAAKDSASHVENSSSVPDLPKELPHSPRKRLAA